MFASPCEYQNASLILLTILYDYVLCCVSTADVWSCLSFSWFRRFHFTETPGTFGTGSEIAGYILILIRSCNWICFKEVVKKYNMFKHIADRFPQMNKLAFDFKKSLIAGFFLHLKISLFASLGPIICASLIHEMYFTFFSFLFLFFFRLA